MKQTRRRHVFFVQGYEPQGADGFYGLFAREWKRFLTTWPVESTLGQRENIGNDIAAWTVETSGPNWTVTTRYEFLRLEGCIRRNLSRPFAFQLGRAARWIVDDLASGALFQVFRASRKMGVLLLYSELMLVAWIGAAIAGGVWAARSPLATAPAIVAMAAAAGFALAIFLALKPLTDRMFVNQLNNCWPYLREFARGAPTEFDRLVDVFAKRLVTAARTRAADEILVVGHSAGAMLGLAVVARALALDPNLGRHGPPISIMTVGSIMPTLALHPAAKALRDIIRRIATDKSVLWVDGQSREDFMNFRDFDPVAGTGVNAGPARCNPLVWQIPFRRMVAPEIYGRVRLNFFRMHYQYIMSNDRRAPYDYYMLVCGPASFADWATQPDDTLAAFAEDAAHLITEPRAKAVGD